MQFLSAYLLAAVAVEDGEYTDDYMIDENDDFGDYMEDGGEDIIGDYIPIDVPTGGSGNGQNFSGNQFCADWYAAFIRPIEYAQIYNDKMNYPKGYPDVNKPDDWTGFTHTTGTKLIPVKLDELVNDATSKHINFWLASVCLKTASPSGVQGYKGLGLTGVYLPSNVAFQIRNNFPTLGYATFSFSYKQGSVTIPYFQSNYNWERKRYNETAFDSNSYINNKLGYILVYNVDVFKAYLNRLSTSELYDLLNDRLFALAECNIKKDWRKKTT